MDSRYPDVPWDIGDGCVVAWPPDIPPAPAWATHVLTLTHEQPELPTNVWHREWDHDDHPRQCGDWCGGHFERNLDHGVSIVADIYPREPAKISINGLDDATPAEARRLAAEILRACDIAES